MASVGDQFFREQLEARRQRLERARAGAPQDHALHHLLEQVDAALARLDGGCFGICEECHEPIEKNRLLADPLVTLCVDHLSAPEARALEQDLQLAARMQRAMLPPQNLRWGDWDVHYHYAPARLVSGDYCDLIRPEQPSGDLVFLLGDVSGKGVAASMLMTQLSAMFRSLSTAGMPMAQMVGVANRVICESSLAGQYATLVCGRAGARGEVEIYNAGHVPPLLVRGGEVRRLDGGGVPLGMFCAGDYAAEKVSLETGDVLFLYTDGLSEARNPAGEEFGIDRLAEFLARCTKRGARDVTAQCLEEVARFAGGVRPTDDLSVMALGRAA